MKEWRLASHNYIKHMNLFPGDKWSSKTSTSTRTQMSLFPVSLTSSRLITISVSFSRTGKSAGAWPLVSLSGHIVADLEERESMKPFVRQPPTGTWSIWYWHCSCYWFLGHSVCCSLYSVLHSEATIKLAFTFLGWERRLPMGLYRSKGRVGKKCLKLSPSPEGRKGEMKANSWFNP